ncbi:MAG: amidohydrolase family protein [Alphaproteobacteria bacterium]|nr:amidohydrolase family protein [Alphaproteobacteria bacterium]
MLGLIAATSAWSQNAPAHAAADWVLTHGKIHTLSDADTVHQAVAVRDGRILALGSHASMAAYIGPKTRVQDLQGRTVIPGLIDSHMHAIRAALSFATEVNWIGARSLTEALARLKAAAQNATPGQWLIVAGGWTEEQFAERRRPTQAELLAAAPHHPVYVQWMYGWAMMTPAAYQALNIQKESDLPGGGKFQLDANQQPTGAVIGGIVPLFDKLPKPNAEQKVIGTRQFFRELNRFGITGVMDPGGFNMDPGEYQPLFQVWRQGELSVRVRYSYFAQKKEQEFEEFKDLTQLLPMGFGDDMLRFHGIGERVTFSMYNNLNPKPADQETFYRVARWAAQNGYTLPSTGTSLRPSTACSMYSSGSIVKSQSLLCAGR